MNYCIVSHAGGKTEIHKRYFHHDEDLLRSHPDFLDGTLPSLDARQAIAATVVPELAAAAGAKAIAEWGRPASDITHVIFCTYSATHMPGADLRLASLLGLRPSVERTMLYYNGCNSGSVALRLAKDIAENNRGARVLVACAEITLVFFRAPDETRTDTLVVPALFGDGAGAVVVGSGPEAGTERPLFEMVSSAQAAIPGTEHVVSTTLGKCGLVYELSSELPSLVAANIERCLVDAWKPLAMGQLMSGDWNDLFWVVHPGGRAVLDGVQDALGLDECKLKASRRVLSEYGNMSGVTIIFVLDEMRRRRHSNGEKKDGVEDMEKESEWGAMVGFGPGLTVETMLLRAMGN
jgi:predicted naringenin-chalcone synthase